MIRIDMYPQLKLTRLPFSDLIIELVLNYVYVCCNLSISIFSDNRYMVNYLEYTHFWVYCMCIHYTYYESMVYVLKDYPLWVDNKIKNLPCSSYVRANFSFLFFSFFLYYVVLSRVFLSGRLKRHLYYYNTEKTDRTSFPIHHIHVYGIQNV